MAQKAVFFDRDDTLISDPGYIKRAEQVKLLPGVPEALIQLKKMGYLLIVVTNQSGIARGYFTEENLDEIHDEFNRQLAADGAMVDGLYYCPYHPEGTVKNFSVESNLRKPNAGMFFQAEKELDIDLTQSWMIGDSYRDMQAGKAAGCHTILVDVPGKLREKKKTDTEPDRKAVNLREAVNIIRMYEFHQKAKSVKQPSEENQNSDESADSSEPDPGTSAISDKSEPIEPTPAEELTVPPETSAEMKTKDIDESQTTASKPTKIFTAKHAAQTQERPFDETSAETHHLLEEIVLRLKRKDREGLYQEFSLFKLLSLMVQVIAVFCLIISVFFWLSPKVAIPLVMIMIGYSIALQLIVIALLMMHSRD
jgi:D-glycero-D-manno-heptose 1,7-bisphosphate phosphatase